MQSSGEIIYYYDANDRGWVRNRGNDDSGHQLVRLRRRSTTAEEGVFTCDIAGDTNTPRYLGVYYPSKLNLPSLISHKIKSCGEGASYM